MPRARYSVCPGRPGFHCTELRDRTTGDCANGCAAAQRKATQARTDAQRPTAARRGYGNAHRTQFRPGVLARHPWCVLCLEQGRRTPSAHADHWPRTRRELLQLGLNPNDPKHGRGLCGPCHSRATAAHDGGYGNPNERSTPGGDPSPQ